MSCQNAILISWANMPLSGKNGNNRFLSQNVFKLNHDIDHNMIESV